MGTRCPICDSTDLDAREMPPGHPHFARVNCRRCGRFEAPGKPYQAQRKAEMRRAKRAEMPAKKDPNRRLTDG